MKKKFQITGIGEVLWDIYPEKKYLGGAVANSVYHITKLGHEGILISKVGTDNLGEELIGELNQRGMSTEYVQADKVKQTGFVKVALDENKVPAFECASGTAYEFTEWNEALDYLASCVDALLFGTLIQINPHSRETLYKFIEKLKNAIIVYDINLRGWKGETTELIEKALFHTGILKLNFDEFLKLKMSLDLSERNTVTCLKTLRDKYDLEMISLSLGAEGGLFLDDREIVYVPGIAVRQVDTTGAGDAFVAALIVKFLEKASLKEIGEFSNILGAFLATKNGATPKYELSEVENFRKQIKKRNYHPEFMDYAV